MNGEDATTSRMSAVIRASREAIYRAFIDPVALEAWQAPGDMTGQVHAMDARVGGGYAMSLFYPETTLDAPGKSGDRDDRFTTRFVALDPPLHIRQIVTFDTDDPAFAGDMTMDIALDERDDGTQVTITYKNLPPGIRPEDNAEGTRQSLAKLARFVEENERRRAQW